MPRKSKASIKRSEAAKRGAITRKRNQQREQRQRDKRNKKRREKARDKRDVKAEKKKIWRLTVLLPYKIRAKRSRTKKRKGTSPQNSSLRATAFYKLKSEAVRKKASLILQAEKRLHDIMKKDSRIFRNTLLPSNVEIESLSFGDKVHTKLLRQGVEIVDEVSADDDEEGEEDDES